MGHVNIFMSLILVTIGVNGKGIEGKHTLYNCNADV